MKTYTKPIIIVNIFTLENVITASDSKSLKTSIGNTKCEYYGSKSVLEIQD